MSAPSTHRVLSHAFSLLDQATTEDGCRTALAEVLAGLAPGSAVACFLAHRSHVIIRGGERTLVREALAARDPEIRAFGEERADAFDPPLRLYRCATTRPDDDGLLRIIETGGTTATGAQLSGDGELIYTFVKGRQWAFEPKEDEEASEEEDPTPEEDAALFRMLDAAPRPLYLEDDEEERAILERAQKRLGAARFQIWRTATGERVAEVRLGKFYDGDGCFAVSPDERTLAVRRCHDFEIYGLPELAGWAGGERPRHRYRVACGEGPSHLHFLDERRLLVNTLEGDLSLWDVHTGQRLASTKSTGSFAVVAGGAQLLMGGFPPKSGSSLTLYSLPGLEAVGACSAPGRELSCTELSLSPDGGWLATEHASYVRRPDGRFDHEKTRYTIYLWPLGELRRALATGSPSAPAPLEPRALATVDEAISSLRFISENRLISGHNDGSIMDWRFGADGSVSSRQIICHDLIVSGIALHPRGQVAVSAGWDGRLVLVDLESRASNPKRRIPYASRASEIRRHSLGIEIVIDDAVAALVPLPPELELEAPLSAEVRPKLAFEYGEDFCFGDLDEPPRLRICGGRPFRDRDAVELDEKHGHTLAVDSRTFAVRLDDHIEFYRLR